MKRTIIFLFVIAWGSLYLYAQEDTVYRKKTWLQRLDSIQNWKIERGRSTLTPFVSPSYSPEMKVLFTAGGLFTFKLNPDNPVLSRSSMPFSVGYSTNGSLLVSVRANIYGKEDKFRLTGEYWNKRMPDNYWGVGYENAANREQSKETTAYQRDWRQLKFKVAYEVLRNFFAGINYDYNETRTKDINPVMAADTNYLKHPGHVYNSGFGMVWRYDSRDFPENAYKGFFIELAGTAYGKHTSSNNIFQVYELDYRQYQKIVREGSTLAWQVKARDAFGDVPWTEMSMIGTPYDLRGYTWGQYRDRCMLFVLTEYRYMFKKRKTGEEQSSPGPFGFVAWTGIGSVAPGLDQLKHWLPNAGLGFRFEIQPRMNVRIDYGVGLDSNAFYISFNEVF